MHREDEPVPGDVTEPLEEGDHPGSDADVPIKGDGTEVVPFSINQEGASLNLSDSQPPGRRSKEK